MKIINLTKGYSTMVSDHRYNDLSRFNWCVNICCGNPYAMRRVKGSNKFIYMSRYIMDYYGDLQIDHRDHDTLNNQDDNLRIATPSQNGANKSVILKHSSIYKGVSCRNGRYRARIKVNLKLITLGTFIDPREAAMAYDAAAVKSWGEFAFTNKMMGLL